MQRAIKYVTFKVTSRCNAACYHCLYRRALYENVTDSNQDLSMDACRRVLCLASKKGLEKVNISGGEPTLAKKLPEYIRLSRAHTENITLITNGWNIREDLWRQLIEYGLSHVDISIDGADGDMHDWLRNRIGLFNRICKLMQLFDKLVHEYDRFSYSIITIVSSFNLLKLDILLDRILHHQVSRWVIHYPECDSDSIFVPSIEKQKHFRQNVLAKLKTRLEQNLPVSDVRNKAIGLLEALYNPSILNPTQIAKGIYHTHFSNAINCNVPEEFLLVKYNGDICGCNGGEYSGDAVIGRYDIQQSLLRFDSRACARLINKRIPYCRHCPVPYTLRIQLR